MRKSRCVIMIAVLLMSCHIRRQGPDTLLRQAEQLISSSPNETLKMLDSIPPQHLHRTARHHLYLLKTQAAYAAYQDISKYPPLSKTALYFLRRGDSLKASQAFLYTGIISKANGLYKKASVHLSEAKEYAPAQADSMLLFQIYYHYGELYYLNHDYQAGMESYQKAIRYHSSRDEINDFEMGDCLLYTRQYAKSREYYRKAELQALDFQDSTAMAYLLFQISTSYSETKNKNQAIHYVHRALTYDDRPKFQKQGKLLLSEIHFNHHQTDSAEYYLKASGISATDADYLQVEYYRLLYGLAEQQQNYRAALEYYKNYISHTKVHLQEKTEERIDNVVNRYHKKKWQASNRSLAQQKKRLAGSMIILILLFLLLATYGSLLLKKRREKYLYACHTIEILQHLCQVQNECQDKFKKLLLDKLEVSKKLAFISNCPQDKHQTFLKMYNDILGDIQRVELDWEELYFTINYLYDNFQQKLQEQFPSLTEKEIQLCCLIRGGFRTDEIAFVIQQSVYSIHKRKTTIRKKLGMDERADILKTLTETLQ